MYVNYYDRIIKKEDEKETMGILLGTNKNKTVVEFTLPKDADNIYTSNYKLSLPSKDDFIKTIEEVLK